MTSNTIDRKIAVVLVADVVGYSKHMEKNEEATLASYSECEKIFKILFKKYSGSIFNTAGDSVLVEFDSAFHFKYSPRNGTKATEFEDHISESIKQRRLEKVISLQKKHSIKRNQHLIGTTQNILVEKQSKMSSDYWAGRTDSNKWVIFKKGKVKINEMVDVIITDSKGISLKGELVSGAKAA